MSNKQPAKLQRKETAKPEPSGMKCKGFVPREILTKFKNGTGKEAIEGVQRKLNLNTIRMIPNSNIYLMKIPEGFSVQKIMESLKKCEEVKYSELNYVRTVR